MNWVCIQIGLTHPKDLKTFIVPHNIQVRKQQNEVDESNDG